MYQILKGKLLYLLGVAASNAVPGLVFPQYFICCWNTALIVWPLNIPINSHLNLVKVFVAEVDVTRISFQMSCANCNLVCFRSIHPCLKNLTVIWHWITTFREGNNMIILKAEATLAAVESLANNIVSCIFSPPLGISTWNLLGFGPAFLSSLQVKTSRPSVLVSSCKTTVTNAELMQNWRLSHSCFLISILPAQGRE